MPKLSDIELYAAEAAMEFKAAYSELEDNARWLRLDVTAGLDIVEGETEIVDAGTLARLTEMLVATNVSLTRARIYAHLPEVRRTLGRGIRLAGEVEYAEAVALDALPEPGIGDFYVTPDDPVPADDDALDAELAQQERRWNTDRYVETKSREAKAAAREKAIPGNAATIRAIMAVGTDASTAFLGSDVGMTWCALMETPAFRHAARTEAELARKMASLIGPQALRALDAQLGTVETA